MKTRLWMQVTPSNMQGGNGPTLFAVPYIPHVPIQGSKLVTFEVDVPDDLFGAVAVEAGAAEVQS